MVNHFSENLSDNLQSLTPKQREVYRFLKDRFYAAGSMPTLRELCKAMGWSAVGTAQDVVQALLEKGFLKRDKLKARGLKLADQEDFRSIPVLGAAPAGHPIEALESHEGDVLIPSFLRGPVFAVRVQGDSMMNAGIEDNDIAIVRQTERAENREIIVAEVEREVTIKRLVKKNSELWLYPENPKYKPRLIESPTFRVLGRVIGLHRYWRDGKSL